MSIFTDFFKARPCEQEQIILSPEDEEAIKDGYQWQAYKKRQKALGFHAYWTMRCSCEICSCTTRQDRCVAATKEGASPARTTPLIMIGPEGERTTELWNG